jgi:hypothetical protein
MHRLMLIAAAVFAALTTAAPAHAGFSQNHNETFLREQD